MHLTQICSYCRVFFACDWERRLHPVDTGFLQFHNQLFAVQQQFKYVKLPTRLRMSPPFFCYNLMKGDLLCGSLFFLINGGPSEMGWLTMRFHDGKTFGLIVILKTSSTQLNHHSLTFKSTLSKKYRANVSLDVVWMIRHQLHKMIIDYRAQLCPVSPMLLQLTANAGLLRHCVGIQNVSGECGERFVDLEDHY